MGVMRNFNDPDQNSYTSNGSDRAQSTGDFDRPATTAQVKFECREDRYAVQLLDTVTRLFQLQEEGITREIPLFGKLQVPHPPHLLPDSFNYTLASTPRHKHIINPHMLAHTHSYGPLFYHFQ